MACLGSNDLSPLWVGSAREGRRTGSCGKGGENQPKTKLGRYGPGGNSKLVRAETIYVDYFRSYSELGPNILVG